MLKLSDVRALYPEYKNLTDYELSTALHRTRYAAMPYEQFAQGFGAPLQEDKAETAARDYNAANPGHIISAQDVRDKDRSGFFGGLRLLGEGIVDAVTDQFPEDMARVWRGGDIGQTQHGLADDIIKRQTKDNAARIPSLQEAEGGILANSLYQGPRSVATSVATGLAGSAAGGAAGSAAGPVGTALGGMVGGAAMSGYAFYRMAKDHFVDEVQQAMQRSMGRTMTSEEAAELNRAIDADATEFGLWEAGPEAISQFFTLGLLKGAGGMALKKLGMGAMSDAIGKRALTRIPAKMAAELGEEETTEGITYFGQEGIRQGYGLRPDAPTLGEFAREQAGPVAVGSLLQLGGMRAAHATGDRMRRKADDVNVNAGQGEDTTPPPLGAQLLSEHDVSPAVPYVFEQSPENMPVPVSPGEFISEADAADIDAFVRNYEAREQAHADTSMLSEYGRPEAQRFTPLQLALEEGNPIDLLALPQDATGVARGIGGLALPPGTGAIPMGTRSTGHGPIAPPSDFAGGPLATPYTPRPALPQQAGPSAGVGRWSGGRSQLAYGNGMMQGLGFVDEQPLQRQVSPAPALPTQAQITSIQQAPRADTMAQAAGLGIPAPEVRPAEERPAPQTPMPVSTPTATPQVEPGWSYSLPSFVTAPHRQTLSTPSTSTPSSPTHTEKTKVSRAELLQQLSSEQRKNARRMTNAQLEERVRAEQNPVPFDKDAIDYTVEDYPMPTAPGGTVFTSASGRKLAPFPQVDYSTPRKHKASNAKVAAWLLDEARKEAAPSEWRSLLIRDTRADNLSPASVDDLVDILSSGVEEESIPPQLKLLSPPAMHEGARQEAETANSAKPVETARQIEPEKILAGKIAENRSSEAEIGVVKYAKQSKENPHGQDDAGTTGRNEGTAQASEQRSDQSSGNAVAGSYEEVQPETGARVVDGRRAGSIRELYQGEGGRRGAEREKSRRTDAGQGDTRGARLADGPRDSDGRLLAGGGAGSSGVARDFRITSDHRIGEGGKIAKYGDNIAAITLLKKLEEEDRQASSDEQAVLARYVGWGGFPEVFAKGDTADTPLARRRAELRSLLTHDEFEAARRSTTNAHFTSPQVVSAMWKAVERMGFKGGSVLEPSMGTGNFIGLMPSKIAAISNITGVELDSLTARIAQQLYPQQRVLNQGFEKARLANGSFDLAISNVPFGDYKLHDPRYAKHNLYIHDYFFARAIDLVRPGGVVAFITSTGSMNSGRSLTMRELVANKARLLGAVRLPGSAFSKNALTDVTTDIIFLQKLKEGEQNTGPSWLSVVDSGVKSEKTGKPLRNNEYFTAYPDMMLGQLADDKLYPGRTALKSDGRDMDIALESALHHLPQDVFKENGQPQHTADSRPDEPRMAGENIKEGTIILSEDDSLLQNIDGELHPYAAEGRRAERIKGMIAVRDALRANLQAQMQGDETSISSTRKVLNKAYDGFTKRNGFINDMANRLAMADDPDAPLLQALEVGYEKGKEGKSSISRKADVFFRRTIAQPEIIERADTPQDALFAQLASTGKIDIAGMARMTGMSENAVLEDLRGSIFKDPKSSQWQTADDYLSGNVREKLRVAREAAKKNDAYKANVAALEAVQPVDVAPADIRVDLGAGWVPAPVVEAFAAKILGADIGKISARYSAAASAWNLETQQSGLSNEYGTPEKSALELLRQSLNMEQATVYDQISREERVLNKAATIAAREAQRKMREDFSAWVFEDEKRAEDLGRLYNDTFNSIRLYEADGKHLILPGIANTIDGKPFALKDHQKNAVWRVIQKGNTLIAHAVGAGKTFEMVAAGMELKRLGMVRKPLYVVPNHMLEQWSREFLQAYPAANLLVASKNDLQKEKRRKFVSRIATGNWDAVIMTHSSFGRIPVSRQRQENFIHEQLGQLEDAIREEKAQGPKGRGASENRLVKMLEKQKMRLEEKLRKLMEEGQDRKDQQVTFEELGVDFLFVDEAHNFKNLQYVTRMKRIAGLPNSSSQRATDMLLKTQYLNEVNPGRSLVFATGTPISNTVAEMYTMTRYVAPHLLKDSGLDMFDSWARQFGRVVTGMEISPDGRNFRENTRFSRFTNVPELLTMFRSFADVKTREDLDLDLPDLKGGKPTVVSVKPSPQLTAYVDELVQRAERIRGGNVDPRKDNMLKVTSEGRLAALDMRLIDDNLSGDPSGKVARATENIYEIWKNTAQEHSAQMVFCDLSVPGKHKASTRRKANNESLSLYEGGQEEGSIQQKSPDELLAASTSTSFSVYDAIKSGLISMGVPEGDIAFIHDCNTDKQKADLFKRVRSGEVRVLLGSTAKMGEGTNVQERLVALHHLDAPWKPSAVEQREGRILRQGNKNKEVQIFTYVTENSFDAYMWQLLEAKARFVSTSMKKDVTERDMDDISLTELSAAEAKAAATGDKRILEKVGLDNNINRLGILKHEFARNRRSKENEVRSCQAVKQSLERQLEAVQKDAAKAIDLTGKNFALTLEGKRYTKVSDAAKGITAIVLEEDGGRGIKVGRVGGFDLVLNKYADGYEFSLMGQAMYGTGRTTSSEGAVSRIVRTVSRAGFEGRIDELRDRMERNARSLEGARKWLANNSSFDKQEELDAAIERSRELDEELGLSKEKEAGVLSEVDENEDGPLASLSEETDRDATPVKVVEVDPGVVPEFKKIRDLSSWLRDYFADQKEAVIASTGKHVLFSNTGLAASVKRSREPGHTHTYAGLNELVTQAEYDSFEPKDSRHPNLGGQEVYYSAMQMGKGLYAVRLKFDVPSENELISRKRYPNVTNEDLRYKDHTLREIEIALIAENYGLQGHTATKAIRTVTLGVLRGTVNPSSLENGLLSSIQPGEFLPPRRPSKIGMRQTAVQKVADALGRRAANAAPVCVVQSFKELPASIREKYAGKVASLEGVYDPRSRVVWLVADNLRNPGRAAEVWAHEQFVHHGLRGLFTDAERKRILEQLWASLGGMGNGTIREIAGKYGLNPRADEKARLTVMEELIASLAEKRALDSMAPQEMTIWNRIVAAVARAWEKLVMLASGRAARMKVTDVDRLLSALGRYVMDGLPHGKHANKMAESPVFASVVEDGAPLASLSQKSDRESLNELVSEWNRRTGLKKEVLLRQLRGYFNVDRMDDIPKEWMEDAEAFVQEKIRDVPDLDKPGFLDKLFTLDMRKTASLADVPEIRSFFHEKDLGLMSGFLSLPHWISKKTPAFAVVYERQLKRMDERAAKLKTSLETVPSIFGKDRLKAADMKSLREMLWAYEGKEPKELENVEKFLAEETLATGRELIKVNPEFYDAYQRWIDGLDGSKNAKSAMLEIRKSLDQDLVQAHNRMAAMSELSDDAIKEFRQGIGHVPNYFPHHRYGAFFVQAKMGDEVVFRRHFDAATKERAMLKAKQIVAEQTKSFPGATWTRGDNVRLPDEVLGAPIDTEAMEQIIRAATAKIEDKSHAKEIAGLLMEGTADVLKARGWGSHGIQRKGIPGFETEDISKVLYDYKAGLNGWLTKMEAAKDFSMALSKIDARQSPGLWKYTSQYVKDMLRNSDRIDRVTGNIKSVAFAWYLGGSIKTAFVNATQNLVVGVPRLQMDVMGGGREWLAGARDALVDRVTGNNGKGLTDEEARLVHDLYGESVITDAFMEEVRGQLHGISGATMWNKFTKTLGWPMSEVERFNRASLAMAAFRAARSGKLKARARKKYGVTGKASYEQAKAFATDVVRDAHFVYGKSNMPEFMRSNTAGRAMSSMYTFRTFTHNMVNMWVWALKTQGEEGAAFVAKSLGATMALGGVTALPLYATLMALFQAATGDDDDWTEKIRSWLPQNNLLRDVICYGAPAMAGVNIGGSLKMETPLTRGLTTGKNPQEVLTESIGEIIGIPYDLLVVKPSRMLDARSKGNTWRILEEAAPVAVKNAMQAWRLHTEGQTTMTGRPINDPGKPGARKLSGTEALGKALGFQPVSSTKSYDAYAATKHADQVRSDKIDELTMLALKSHDTGTPDGKLEMRKKMRAWNAKMEAEGKPHMLIREKDVIRRVKSRRRENRVTPKTLRQGARQQEVWG